MAVRASILAEQQKGEELRERRARDSIHELGIEPKFCFLEAAS